MAQTRLEKTEETRKKIIETSKELFIEKGYFDTQMTDIANATSIGRKTLYRYFHDKSELGCAILKKVLLNIDQQLERSLSLTIKQYPEQHAHQLVHALANVYRSPQIQTELRFMAEFDAYFSGNRVPHDFQQRLLSMSSKPIHEEFLKVAELGQKAGTIDTKHSPNLIITTLTYTLKTQYQQMAIRQQALVEFMPDQNQLLLPALIDLLITGLASN